MKDVLLRALSRYPVFTASDVAAVLDKSREYAHLVAHRLKRARLINEIEKGKYTCDSDPMLIASWITWPSYISSWAALSYYKLTEQLPFTIHVVTTRKRKVKTIVFQGTRIEFVKVKPSSFFGFDRVNYQGREVFIAEKEKAIIDGLIARKISLEEAVEIVKNNPGRFNVRKLLTYSRISRGLTGKLNGALK